MGIPAQSVGEPDYDATGACGETTLHVVGEVDAAVDEPAAVNEEIARRTGLEVGACIDAYRYRSAASFDVKIPCANGLIARSTADTKRLTFQSLRVRPSHFLLRRRHQAELHEHSGDDHESADFRR
jgi:hypothetical protein